MHIIGTINREIYKCITEDILTDEVIITSERMHHIKERHPNDYAEVMQYIADALLAPDYILQDENDNTGLVIKASSTAGKNIQAVIRIQTASDKKGYKNSIISCWLISNRRLQNYLRNKEILYKKA